MRLGGVLTRGGPFRQTTICVYTRVGLYLYIYMKYISQPRLNCPRRVCCVVASLAEPLRVAGVSFPPLSHSRSSMQTRG